MNIGKENILPKNVFYIFILFKIFPVFLLTHDWNIVSSEYRGLSSYLFEFTLGPILHKQKSNYLFVIIMATLFILSLFSYIILQIACCSKFQNKNNSFFVISLYIIYIIPFFLINLYTCYL